MIDLDALEALAKAATPGKWQAPHHPESIVNVWTDAGKSICHEVSGPDATFIAAANPAAVLELIAEVRRLREVPSRVTEKTWNELEISSAFFETFHRSGERWFDYLGSEDEAQASTSSVWDDFWDELTKRA